MIAGAHAIVFSTDPDADRAFLRDVLGLPNIDIGAGWLIFGLPSAEVAVHPGEDNGRHELFFVVEDLRAFVAAMKARDIRIRPPQDTGWGRLTELTLPGGGTIGVYQPKHERPPRPSVSAQRSRRVARVGRGAKDSSRKPRR